MKSKLLLAAMTIMVVAASLVGCNATKDMVDDVMPSASPSASPSATAEATAEATATSDATNMPAGS